MAAMAAMAAMAEGFVTAELVGGLGNQLFVLFAAVAHGLRAGLRPLFHELPAAPSVTPRHTYWRTLLRGAPRAWLTPEAPEAPRRHHCGPRHDPPPAPRWPGDSLRLEGYAMHWRYAGAEAREVARRLGLFERLAEGEALLRGELGGTPSGGVVAVHVRRGDYLRLQQWHRVLSPGYYRRAARALAALRPRAAGPPLFLLFSDEPQDAELASVRAALEPFGAVRRAAFRPGEADAEDFAMMAACDAFVLANSTFSWWAARLAELRAAETRAPAPLVIMPDVEHAELPGRSLPQWLQLPDAEDGAEDGPEDDPVPLDLRAVRAYLVSPGRGAYEARCAEALRRLVRFGFREVVFVRSPEHPDAGRSLARANLLVLERELAGPPGAAAPFAIFEDDCAFREDAPVHAPLPRGADALYLGVSHWVYPHGAERLLSPDRGHIRPCEPGDFEPAGPGPEVEGPAAPCVRLRGGTTSTHGVLFASRAFAAEARALLLRAEALAVPHDLALAALQRDRAVYALRAPLVWQDAALGGQEAATRLRFRGGCYRPEA